MLSIDETRNAFAAALSFLLKNKPRKTITQTYIGLKIGKSQSYIGQLARGERAGTEETRRKIAEIYGYNKDEAGKTYDDFLKIGQKIISDRQSPQCQNYGEHILTSSVKEGKKEYRCKNSTNDLLEKARLTVITTEHKNIIDSFQNKEIAYEINKKLLEIEKAAPDKLETIRAMIDGVYNTISRKKRTVNGSG